MATQNVEIRRRAKFPSDFVLGGYLVAMDRVLNPLIPFLSHPAFFKFIFVGCFTTRFLIRVKSFIAYLFCFVQYKCVFIWTVAKDIPFSR